MRGSLIIFLALFLFSCEEEIRTRDHGTRLNSKDYPEKKERLAIFHKFIGTETAITDVEFDLFNVNGFDDGRLIPGASSLHYRYVLKVDPKNVNPWIDFLMPVDTNISLSWQDSLVSSRKELWARKSIPLYFKWKVSQNDKGPVFVTAYEPEGIIFREVIRN